jgi:hypothetical protein
MSPYITSLVMYYCISFGVIMGGCLLSGVGAVFTFQSPTEQMLGVAHHIKIWAIVAAIGGTIDPIRYIENQVAEGHIYTAMKQILLIIVAFLGAQSGNTIIQMMCKAKDS